MILEFHVYFSLLDDQMAEMVIQPCPSQPPSWTCSQPVHWLIAFCLIAVDSLRLSEYPHWKLWCDRILRWLLTWGLIASFLIFFITTFSRLSLAWMAPAELQTTLLCIFCLFGLLCFPAAWLSASPINSSYTRTWDTVVESHEGDVSAYSRVGTFLLPLGEFPHSSLLLWSF